VFRCRRLLLRAHYHWLAAVAADLGLSQRALGNEPLVTECKKLSRAVHLFALSAGSTTDRSINGARRDRNRLRDSDLTGGHAATSHTNVGARPTSAAIAKTGGVQLSSICRGEKWRIFPPFATNLRHTLVLLQFIRFYHWAFRRQHTAAHVRRFSCTNDAFVTRGSRDDGENPNSNTRPGN